MSKNCGTVLKDVTYALLECQKKRRQKNSANSNDNEFPKLITNIKSHIQEFQITPNRINI